MEPERNKKPRPPLDREALQRLAIHYVGRYATTRAKLKTYLRRKVKERGWDGPSPDLDALTQRFADLGYIDDAAFASARTAALQRRGYGERRVVQALHAAGVEEEDVASSREQAKEGAMDAALRFARRKRIGPYAAAELDRDAKQKAFAAMMRAGHPMDVVREVLDASPGDIPDSDKV